MKKSKLMMRITWEEKTDDLSNYWSLEEIEAENKKLEEKIRRLKAIKRNKELKKQIENDCENIEYTLYTSWCDG